MHHLKLYPELNEKLKELENLDIPENRKKILQPLIEYIQQKKDAKENIKLNFICTHNSRRSQLAQIWAKVISEYKGIEVQCFSGGTEETAFFINAINALRRAGFKIDSKPGENPEFEVGFSKNSQPLKCYSKVYEALGNPSKNFAAIMTCSHADENCPFIPGSEVRIALDYKDPKEFDNTPKAQEKYSERSDQIGSEMIYVFENIS
ncbi:arsenate reductase [Christiangramia forsetii]|uniref:ArsC-like arsenate reductase n=2 Tax=Christiangramia forsetii TaxID=411153 RepID=A0M3G8_CHRFK|nr:arsenate reductase [Christiangramia forsetii]GGG25892.1 arsenate reductase [Christiangramia forsetii]CAL67163.1 ArsC-like arsenate reductase [Christiangramia forsetii KT0803]